ncbi:MAG TPA: hypothetical protein OIL90_09725 [Phascolarctobacterium faecium]|jgi:hypothetical protein|uniref:hypothetical protein n=1 Tax=Phascolarctobacterium faecium TaxID=33025 RepID=UPI00204D3090|nr:hypothetical protein [Phascolarctobacterium faecium]DAY12442.1 MAG TPA: hypothetical protein [Caudoviricetes sp.]HJI10383.1 hypothetical protein [Phascolarctobacterium faecium]
MGFASRGLTATACLCGAGEGMLVGINDDFDLGFNAEVLIPMGDFRLKTEQPIISGGGPGGVYELENLYVQGDKTSLYVSMRKITPAMKGYTLNVTVKFADLPNIIFSKDIKPSFTGVACVVKLLLSDYTLYNYLQTKIGKWIPVTVTVINNGQGSGN